MPATKTFMNQVLAFLYLALRLGRRDPQALVAEDNLRVIPGFTPWVEAFARSAWGGSGAPFDDVLARWIAH